MPHTHAWRVVTSLALGLPRNGFCERYTEWRCTTCRQFAVITGDVKVGFPLMWPEFWDRLAAAEQQQATPHARQAAHEQRRRIA